MSTQVGVEMVRPVDRRPNRAERLLEKIPQGDWVIGIIDETTAAGVQMSRHDTELAVDIAEKGREYGYADEYLRPLRYIARSNVASLNGARSGGCLGPMTLPLGVLHHVTQYLEPNDLSTLLVTSPAFFEDRDEVIWKPKYQQIFRYRSGKHGKYADLFREAVLDRPKGSLAVNGNTFIISGNTLTPSGITPASGLSIDGQAHISLYPVGVGKTMIVVMEPMPAREQQRLLGELFAHGLSSVTYSMSPPREPRAEPPLPLVSQYRIAVIGAGNVGKSAISVRYIQATFVPHYDPNICDTYKKQDKVDSKICFLEVVDMAGQEEYASLRSQYYRKSDGLLAVYSITDPSSLEELKAQYAEVLQERDATSVPMVLIGNKCDVADAERMVTREDGFKIAAGFGDVPFFETSAKEKTNIAEAFHQLVREIRANRSGTRAIRPGEAMGLIRPATPESWPQRTPTREALAPPVVPPKNSLSCISVEKPSKKLAAIPPATAKRKKKSRKRCAIM
eukprot:TRINITY_DN298_c1_g2_i1.p1 TRINITY_DN298_c1_g2~~TRINITY_DN298_c1_g2_i1.p1  ORF type:complete len:507 (+),score=88.57 TRINITY_DN298_c1_g2_i1:355-1875(+)